jgi:chorismate mutase
MPNELIVKQYKIILDEFDLEMVKQIAEEMEHNLYALPLEEATIQGILKQIINQSNNEQSESREDS